MHPFRYHVFVCEQRKAEGLPSCSARGSAGVIDALRHEIAVKQLFDIVAITPCGSLGMCENGPNLVVYPEGTWYSHVTPADVSEIVTEHFQNGRRVERLMRSDEAALKKEIGENRGKALAMLKARDSAGALPEEIEEMSRGYMASRVLLTAIELNLFTELARAGSTVTARALAAGLQTDAHATEVLLDALAALGLLSKRDGVYANAPSATRFLVAGAKDDSSTSLKHQLSLWNTWSALTEVVRTGKPAPRQPMDARGEDWTLPFITAMHRNASMRAPALAAALDLTTVRRVIDIGGGSAAYSIALARANPNLVAEVFDLPSVVSIAQRYIAEAGLSDRVQTRTGDLQLESFGTGYDLALLSAICHMLGPDENRDLLRRVFAALAPGGRVAIQDFIMSPDKTSPRAGALFAINMLVGTPHGSTFSEAEYTDWLREAGFNAVQRLSLPGPSQLIVAKRP